MTRFFLGADVGGTKTRVLIADEFGRPAGFGEGGPGNPEGVGYAGMVAALRTAAGQALAAAGLSEDCIAGAGYGVAGYDWPSQRAPTLQAIARLGISAPVELVNDTIIGLLAGAPEGWGVAIVSGTGCNCRGWDRERRREGRVTGHGLSMGEAAGGSELVLKALQAVAHEWTRRGPPTQLTPAFLYHTGMRSAAELLEGVLTEKLELDASAAPLVFEVAAAGDPVAVELVRWAGQELGEMANAVIRQLEFEDLEFGVVLIGSMFGGGPLLIEPMRQTIHDVAPGAHLVRLTSPPVVGAVLLGMEAAGLQPVAAVREALGQIQAEEADGTA